MRIRAILPLAASLAVAGGVGTACLTIYDTFHVAVNVDGLEATFSLLPNASTSYSGSVMVSAHDYISGDFDVIDDVRIYDIRVGTTGSYAGDVTGSIRVNGIEFTSFSGPWSAFADEQSLLTGGPITANQAGIAVVTNAILEQRDIFVEIVGSVSQAPIPSGLQIRVEVLGQVDAEL